MTKLKRDVNPYKPWNPPKGKSYEWPFEKPYFWQTIALIAILVIILLLGI